MGVDDFWSAVADFATSRTISFSCRESDTTSSGSSEFLHKYKVPIGIDTARSSTCESLFPWRHHSN
jgi:hypothetical protein